jgi:hypothetical protein
MIIRGGPKDRDVEIIDNERRDLTKTAMVTGVVINIKPNKLIEAKVTFTDIKLDLTTEDTGAE